MNNDNDRPTIPPMTSIGQKGKRRYGPRAKPGEIVIEHGVPLPPAATGKAKYPWEQLEVSDSFFVPGEGKSVRATAYKRNKLGGAQYAVRNVKRRNVDGVRVWRVK